MGNCFESQGQELVHKITKRHYPIISQDEHSNGLSIYPYKESWLNVRGKVHCLSLAYNNSIVMIVSEGNQDMANIYHYSQTGEILQRRCTNFYQFVMLRDDAIILTSEEKITFYSLRSYMSVRAPIPWEHNQLLLSHVPSLKYIKTIFFSDSDLVCVIKYEVTTKEEEEGEQQITGVELLYFKYEDLQDFKENYIQPVHSQSFCFREKLMQIPLFLAADKHSSVSWILDVGKQYKSFIYDINQGEGRLLYWRANKLAIREQHRLKYPTSVWRKFQDNKYLLSSFEVFFRKSNSSLKKEKHSPLYSFDVITIDSRKKTIEDQHTRKVYSEPISFDTMVPVQKLIDAGNVLVLYAEISYDYHKQQSTKENDICFLIVVHSQTGAFITNKYIKRKEEIKNHSENSSIAYHQVHW